MIKYLKVHIIPVLLIILTVIGFVLRIKIGLPQLASDEVATVVTSSQSFPMGIINALVTKNFHSPLFYFILHFWMKIFGEDTFVLRLLPVLMGTACIPAAYFCGKNLHSKLAGVLAAVLVTFNFFLISYSHFCKFYAFLQLLGFLSVYFLTKFDMKKQKKDLFLWVLINSMIVYTYVLGFLFVAIQFFVYVLYRIFVKNSSDNSFISKYLLLLGIFVLPAVPMIFKIVANTQSSGFPAFWWYKFQMEHVLSVVYTFFSPAIPYLYIDGSITEATQTYYSYDISYLVIFNLIPTSIAAIGLVKAFQKKNLSACLLYSALLFIIAEFTAALLGKFAFCARFTTLCFPALLLAVVSGLLNFKDKRISCILTFFCVFSSILYILFPVYSRFNTGVSDIFKMTDILTALNLKKNDCIIIPFRGYYLQKFYDVSDINYLSYDINYAFKTGDKSVIDVIFDKDDISQEKNITPYEKFKNFIEAKEPSKSTELHLQNQCVNKLGKDNKVYLIMYFAYLGDNYEQALELEQDNIYKLLALKFNYNLEKILDKNFPIKKRIDCNNFVILQYSK